MSEIKYIILDGCVVAANYVEESSHRYPNVISRVRSLIQFRKHSKDCQFRLLVPNICVPEVFSIFSKYRYGSWNKHVKDHTIDDLKYWEARLDFRNDIHNSKILQQRDLSRYDILATDLISAPDHYYKLIHEWSKNQVSNPMGAFDHSIIGIGIQLAKTVGRENVLLLTSDNRMIDILKRVSSITKEDGAKLGLIRIARDLGLEYGPHIYPVALNISKCSDSEIQQHLKNWPLPEISEKGKTKKVKLTHDQEQIMADVYDSFTGRFTTTEKIPYTDEFEVFCNAFVSKTGCDLSRHEIWNALSNMRKSGKLTRKLRNK